MYKRSSYSADSGTTTDVISWIRNSGPRSLDEIALLRKGLRKNVIIASLFERQIHQSQNGRELWSIKGHQSTLLLASEKHIEFFRNALKQREKGLKRSRTYEEAALREQERAKQRYEQFVAENGEPETVPLTVHDERLARAELRQLFDLRTFSRRCAVTLTMKKRSQGEANDRIKASRNFRHFLRLLNTRLLGSKFSRFGVRIQTIAVIEENADNVSITTPCLTGRDTLHSENSPG